MSRQIAEKLEASRKDLLDLGLRNPLINYHVRSKKIDVVDEISREIYRILVTEGSSMYFLPASEDTGDKQADIKNSQPETEGFSEDQELDDLFDGEDADWSELFCRQDSEQEELAERYVDKNLQTRLDSVALHNKLLTIHNDARIYLQEQGVSILYLALGFLHWYESDDCDTARKAPLVLIPVNLERLSVRKRFRLFYTGDDIEANLSLIEKLRNDFKITLPEMKDDDFNIEEYFNQVETKTAAHERWSVERDTIILGFFSFGKFLMYRDLDVNNWPDSRKPSDHKVICSLLGDGFEYDSHAVEDAENIDKLVPVSDSFIIKDADSSQVLSILDVKNGGNLVIQGPPGTGKSQTITNMIADAIGHGKKVLFVSEKMAALEVVKRRLDEVGLGDAVLELHSHKTRKKAVIEELDRTLNAGRPLAVDMEDDVRTLEAARDRLNSYCMAVNTPVLNTRITPIQAIGRLLNIGEDVFELQRFDFQLMKEWSDSDYKQKRSKVDQLILRLREIGVPGDNPFWGVGITSLMPSDQEKLKADIQEAVAITKDLCEQSALLAQKLTLENPVSADQSEMLCRAGRCAVDAPELEGISVDNELWANRPDDILKLLDTGLKLENLHRRYDDQLIDAAWDQDLIKVRQYYSIYGRKWWRILSSRYRQARATLTGLCRKEPPKKAFECIELIDAVLEARKQSNLFNKRKDLGPQLFGRHWQNENSDWQLLKDLTQWMLDLYRDVKDKRLPPGIIRFLAGLENTRDYSEHINRVKRLLRQQRDKLVGIDDDLKFNAAQLYDSDEKVRENARLNYDQQMSRLNIWIEDYHRLPVFVQYIALQAELIENGLKFVLKLANTHPQGAVEIGRIFDATWYEGLIHHAFSERRELSRFNRTDQEYNIRQFRDLDNAIIRNNRSRLALLHWESIPSLETGNGQLAIIKREVNKKRRHLPIRRLIESAGQAMQAIKPVFMMGPQSIAKYLTPGKVEFDLVIFDEASQVKPVDAFGAILRGKQAVVVGDSRQLPPTSFFDALISDDEDNYDDSVVTSDLESILGLFCGQNSPQRMLKWHYRSRHESLIAVSNYEFYDNKLMIFPSSGQNISAKGLIFEYLPGTVYDRGKTRRNSEEAKAVAQAVMDHAGQNPGQSLGVVAFSTAQREAIERHLELLRKKDPSCEEFFNAFEHEPFFIKNLENVQGDERDVIFISIGYGKTQDGKMSMNFGPLNQAGGERRLNVLISRARQTCRVFANFTAEDLDLDRSDARGVKALKSYLSYARSRILEQDSARQVEFDRPFEDEVMMAVEQLGYDAVSQVGVAGYRIDIGIVDKDNPGSYILGIECDGNFYNSAKSARDRDRLRSQVLKGLGWRIHRVWSADWFRDSKTELDRVVKAIQRAREYWSCDEKDADQVLEDMEDDADGIERSNVTPQSKSPFNVETYKKASLSGKQLKSELHEVSAAVLSRFVERIVKIEGPVHIDNVTERIADAAGVTRITSRIKNSVRSAVNRSVQKGKIRARGDFLWDIDRSEPRIRDRSAEDVNIKHPRMIAPEEITAGLTEVVAKSFSIDRKNLISSTFKLFGINRVTAGVEEVADRIIDGLIEEGKFVVEGETISMGNVDEGP